MKNSIIWDKKTENTANWKGGLLTLSVVCFWLAVWEVLYRMVAQEVLLVSPVRAFLRLGELSVQLPFWKAVGATCLRVAEGFLLAVVVGTLLATGTAASRFLQALFSPLLGVVRSTPVASFIILALVWINTDRLPAFIAFLMVVPVVWSNVFAGIRGTDAKQLEMARVFHLSFWKRLRYIYIPHVMPHYVAAWSTGLGAAWKSAIAAEVIAHPKLAMGRQIYNAKIYLETLDLFAWTIAVVLLSILLEKVTVVLLKHLNKRLMQA